MEYLIGVGLAAVVCAFAALSGFDRDRAFYPTVVIVVAHYYILFAAMSGSITALVQESAVAVVFAVLAVIGFKKNLWLAAVALAGHGIFDFIHHQFIHNPGVPEWWPGFCAAFDIAAGGFLGFRLKTLNHRGHRGTQRNTESA
jgi:hypothetical protein